MKSILIFFFYFLSIIAVTGYATFLMYHNIDEWGWVIFIDVLLMLMTVKVKEDK
ncbi:MULTISPECIES: hypothetical protein [Haemophilus]|uniref:Uncharacterized protein n=1 Tax=Haemophilus aegyptius TaxID=197575 RepID=A0ABY1VSF8_HAEAE|nr:MULTISPECIES: hypothetical protein [Haemophilus]EGF18051.1 hypothetical protein HMPREF9095_0405 [Haemophilus aegyptius ATCC 11116]UAK82775.1 hypothetical protein K8O83_01000 [Haemophilus aegyptius]SQH35540.1 Uncharacterised protein [Haemophilus aegyptius]VEH52145.1 Uncharacterised protein [Haemophilus aegyptius]